jgi:hypothetical protein
LPLKQLLQDITTIREANYDHLPVYDMSRRGCFQDTDESAFTARARNPIAISSGGGCFTDPGSRSRPFRGT